jgi:arylsulfatase A-like enzyme
MSLAGCSKSPPAGPRDLVVLVLDAVRKDHLSVYGYERDTSPTIDALARQGVMFDRAYTPAPWTLASVASLLTGNMPETHGAGTWSDDRSKGNPTALSGAAVTITERLKDAGYKTYCRSANPYLDLGVTQGFDRSETLPGNAQELVDWGLDAANEAGDRPLFLYLQFMDAHTARDLPTEFTNLYATPDAGERLPVHKTFDEWIIQQFRDGELERYRKNRIAVYDGAIRLIDREIARLLKGLEKRGRLDRTWVVVMSDHGEEFWDHFEIEEKCYHDSRGFFGVGHGHSLFEELVGIPLIVRGPEAAAGHRVRNPVSLVDLGPTLLDLMGPGEKIGEYTLGRSRAAALRGGEVERTPIFAQQLLYGHKRRTVIDVDDVKLIRSYDPREKDFLFDLKTDPHERDNRIDKDPERVTKLKAMLDAYFDALPKARDYDPSTIRGDTMNQLKQIGYVGGGAHPAESRKSDRK